MNQSISKWAQSVGTLKNMCNNELISTHDSHDTQYTHYIHDTTR